MTVNGIDFNQKTILITGGAGFIGSNLAFFFQENYPNSHIIIFDRFRDESSYGVTNVASFGHYKNLIGFKGDVLCGDITNLDDLCLLDDYSFDYIFHQAAISDTRASNQVMVMRTNVNSFYWLLGKAQKDCATLVYASSAAIYGGVPSPQAVGRESPENAYAFSKYAMDQIACRYTERYSDMRLVGLRYFNVYGPRESQKGKTASMVFQLTQQILNGKKPRLFIGSDKIFRDFVNVADVIQANVKAACSNRNGIFNVGSGVARSFQEVADIIQGELGVNLGTDYFSNPYDNYQEHTQADIFDTKKYLQFEPEFSLEAGIKSYIPYIRNSSYGYS